MYVLYAHILNPKNVYSLTITFHELDYIMQASSFIFGIVLIIIHGTDNIIFNG